MIAVVVVLAVALAAGLWTNRTVRPRVSDDREGSSVLELFGAATALSGLFLALVLFDVDVSYSQARSAVGKEANAIDNLFESTEYVGDPMRQAMQASIVCYLRAVTGPEWEAMEHGRDSPVPSNYTGAGPLGLRRTFIEMGPSHELFGKLTSADATRGDLRRERIAAARPKVPTVVSGFMLLLVGLGVVAAAFSIPRTRNGPHIVALVVVTALIGGTLLLVRALDRPFSGVLRIQPTELEVTEAQDTKDYLARYPDRPLPCDEHGDPLPAR